MNIKRILSTAVLTLFAVIVTIVPAQAVDLYGDPVINYALENDVIALEVDGLETGYNVYAAQITMRLSGVHSGLTLTSNDEHVDVENRTTIVDGDTQLVVYLDCQAPMNDGTKIHLGYLNVDDISVLPTTAELVLLDANLDRTEGKVGVVDQTKGGSSGGGQVSSGTTPEVKTNGKGTVVVTPKKADAGEKVTVEATPDSGYEVASIAVTDKKGKTVNINRVDQNHYTFIQPKDAPVTIRVEFASNNGFPFVDVKQNDWYFDAVSYVHQKGLMSGTSATTFAPDRTTTRGMIVTILHRMEGTPSASGASFKDVPAGKYYTDAVAWAASNDIVTGYGTGLFGPEDTITRQQMAAILYRYAQYKQYDVSVKADLSNYRDAGEVKKYAAEAMNWANANGLISGIDANTLRPNGSATRAQVAAILMRFCENIAS